MVSGTCPATKPLYWSQWAPPPRLPLSPGNSGHVGQSGRQGPGPPSCRGLTPGGGGPVPPLTPPVSLQSPLLAFSWLPLPATVCLPVCFSPGVCTFSFSPSFLFPKLSVLSPLKSERPAHSGRRAPRPPACGVATPAPPRPAPPVATFRFTAGSSIPTWAEGTCATAAGAPGRRTRQANLPAPPGPPPRLQPQLSSGPCESGHVIAVRLLRDGVGVHALPPGSQLPRLKAQAAPGGGRRTSGFLSQRARYLAELLSQQVD